MDDNLSIIKHLINEIKHTAFCIERQKNKIETIKKKFEYEPIYEQKVLNSLYAKMNKLEYQLYKQIDILKYDIS